MNAVLSSVSAPLPLILCIDDGDIALRVKKLLLTSAGYNMLAANSAEMGLEIFKQQAVDLVISDHFLNGKTGAEIAREMKILKPEIPILLVSAALEKPEGTEFADGFLGKCEPTELLLETIAALLSRKPVN